MSAATDEITSDRASIPALIPSVALVFWLALLCILPDPRPLGAPEWAVKAVRFAIGLSEPAARAAATIVLRSVGIGMIGILLPLALKGVRSRYATPLVLVASPVLALGSKWINFGYLPITPQLELIVVVAMLGALLGLAIQRSRTALAALVILSVTLFAWGASTGVSDDVYEAARQTGLHVLDSADEVVDGDEGFEQLLEIAFAYAEDNSHGIDARLPNQAAILALGVILGEDRVARVGRRTLEPGREEDRAALRRRITLRGRQDLSRHFWVSAALVVLSDERRALSVGITKELKDSTPGGSGFSFVDMVANKAGIRLAVAATRDAASARRIQLRIAQGVNIDNYMPDINGFPEGLTRDEFHSDFGGLGGGKTQKLFAEIDERLRNCEGLW